jgi:hypothetical protein
VIEFIKLLKKFADDTKLGQTTILEGQTRMQEVLDCLCELTRVWGMQFNEKKCKVMHVGHSNTKQTYSMNGHQLDRTEVEQDIKVSVTWNLEQADQCKKAAKTAQTVLSQVTIAFYFRDRHVFMRLYVQYIRTHLEFSAPARVPLVKRGQGSPGKS